MTKTRVKFCCPSCQRQIGLPRRYAGKKTRCPQCSGALRAPDPRRGKGAYNYERCIESLLHPDRFLGPTSPRPKILGIPMPEPHHALVGSAAAILVGGVAWLGYLQRNGQLASSGSAEPSATLASVPAPIPPPAPMDNAAMQKAAQEVVTKFLAADGWQGKATFVRDAARVRPLMKDYYERNGGDAPTATAEVTSTAPGFYATDQLPQPVSNVSATLSDGRSITFRVEHLVEGAKVEWESSVAYSPASWDQILNSTPEEAGQLLRVSACLDNYYNYSFSDDREFLCLQLQDPITGIPLGNGYVPRHSEDGARLHLFLQGSTKRQPEQVTLEVRPATNASKTRQVEIVRFVKGGFRHAEAPVMAAASQ